MMTNVKSGFSNYSSAYKERVKYFFSAFVLVLALSASTTLACEGPELVQTLQIIQNVQNEAMQLIYGECAASSNPLECMFQVIAALNQKYDPIIRKLSPSCQALIQQMGSAGSGGGGGGGGTQCMGGVCCDGTGCYR